MKHSKHNIEPLVRVLLVDSDAAFGRRLAQILDGPSGFRLCGQVLDAAAAQTAVATQDPDFVVVNTDGDSTDAFHLVCRLVVTDPGRRILATSCHCHPAAAEKALLAGARGVLLKTEPDEEILSAFWTVVRNQIYVSRALSMPLLKRLLSDSAESARSGVESLTDRELRVFELLGSGLSTREVAARLGLSCKTVESHREKIKHRLGVEGAAALAQCACAWVQRSLQAGCPTADGSVLGPRSEPPGLVP